jgi:toxin ParE1/3/4
MRFVVTDDAKADIERIAAYIALESPRAAREMVAKFRARFREIREHPNANTLAEGFEARGLRRKIHGNYLIFYRVTYTQIEVLRVLHGARDIPSVLES